MLITKQLYTTALQIYHVYVLHEKENNPQGLAGKCKNSFNDVRKVMVITFPPQSASWRKITLNLFCKALRRHPQSEEDC